MTTYSLYDLNEFIRRVIALNIPRAVWVHAEIAQCNLSRGHMFLNLIQKEEEADQILAKSDAIIWAKEYKRLMRKIGKEFNALLQEGVEVKLFVRVDFNERFGMKLIVEDIDPVYTIGKLEMARLETIALLKKQQLLHKNQGKDLPVVLQRIALISSETAAGYSDFMNQLKNNSYQYSFKTTLFSAAMQGQQTSPEILRQLEKIQLSDSYDCVVITRGGGAKLDLIAFDDFELNKAIAECKIPVLVGVGHETDDCIVDLVAHTALKTPTAVAEFLINHNLHFEAMLLQVGKELYLAGYEQIKQESLYLEEVQQNLKWESQGKLNSEQQQLSYILSRVEQYTGAFVRQQTSILNHLEELCYYLSPRNTLKRGYSLTTKDNKLINKSVQIKDGEQIESHFATKTIISEIIEIKPPKL